MAKATFGQWLREQRVARGWTQADLARAAGLKRSAVHYIEHDSFVPGVQNFVRLAQALELSPLHLFRRAGLLPEISETKIRLSDWEYLLSQLSTQDEAELRQIARLKINNRQKEKARKSLKKQGAG